MSNFVENASESTNIDLPHLNQNLPKSIVFQALSRQNLYTSEGIMCTRVLFDKKKAKAIGIEFIRKVCTHHLKATIFQTVLFQKPQHLFPCSLIVNTRFSGRAIL